MPPRIVPVPPHVADAYRNLPPSGEGRALTRSEMDHWAETGEEPTWLESVHFSTLVKNARPGRGEDRVRVRTLSDRTEVLVADGAGGVSRGAEAADALCAAFSAARCASSTDWVDWLEACDREAARSGAVGLAAALVLTVSNDGAIFGASVGDCEAWVFDGNGVALTEGQLRKPLLGSGDARIVGFVRRFSRRGTLVAASDGLWKYTPPARIAERAIVRPLDTVPAALVDGARLPSGALQDDVGVVVVDLTST